MSLERGSRIASYEILEPIGAGGMGEVYRARDTKLGRDVAIKVLPEEFSSDPERLARFEREARLLAQLNHTNVATLYGLEEANGQQFLAMELVEGETLAERMAHGPIPLDEAIPIFLQIAEGLDAAHEKAIIHRDLKPANVKITPDGDIKILDFGLAKAFAGDTADVDSSLSPTITRNATAAGVIMGTAAYMSPEQARGKSVDKRTDIWSFGVVLYEALTGKQLFTGETVSDVLAAVLTREIDLDATAPQLRRLLQRCLERDPKQRLRDIGEARIALAEPNVMAPTTAATASRPVALVWPLLALVLIAGIAAIWGWLRPESTPPQQVARLQLNLPEGSRPVGYNRPGMAISRDGGVVAIPVIAGGENQIHVYRMATGDFETMPELRSAGTPFFSPFGTWLGYSVNGGLYKIAIDGGEAVALAEVGFGASWAPDDTIVFTPEYNSGLERVSAGGGDTITLTEPDASRKELGHWYPQVLPDGDHVLFTNYSTPIERARIEVLSLSSGERKIVLEGGLFGRYVPSGHLVYLTRDALMAKRFHLDLMEAEGLPTPVAGDVYANTDGFASLDFAENGTLVYAPVESVSPQRNLVWVDRDGNVEPILDERRRYTHPRLSPDGRLIAVTVEEGISSDVWVLDPTSGTLSRISFGDTADFNANWTPDGRRLFYSSERDGAFAIYTRASDASTDEEPLLATRYDTHPSSVSPVGDALLFTGDYELADGTAPTGTWLVPVEGDDPPSLLAEGSEGAVYSPDGRWIALASTESGRSEIYVQPVAGTRGKTQVSANGGIHATWSHDGRELYFRSGRTMMAASVDGGEKIRTGRPRPLFEGDFEYSRRIRNYDVAPDGRFLMVQVPESAERGHLVVVINWFEELKRLVPTEE